jgi:transposase
MGRNKMESKITGFVKMMEGSIGVDEPWYIKGAEFIETAKEVHIYVDTRNLEWLPCPICGELSPRHGYEKKERIWRHGDCLFYPSYVHCRRPRIKCKDHGVKLTDAPWARKNSRFTLLFEGYAMLVLADTPVRTASELLRCDEKSLTNIMHYWVNKAVDEDDLSDVTAISIDETSFKKGQSYVTIVIDAVARRVVDVEEGRNAETVNKFAKKLEIKGGKSEKIAHTTSDMSKAYLSGTAKNFPNAQHTIDKFHVKKLLIDAMDDVRKEEQKEQQNKKALFQGRRLFMIPEKKQTDIQKIKLAELSKMYPKTGRAYRIVAGLDEMYLSTNAIEAQEKLSELMSWMRRSRLKPMKEKAETLKTHSKEILNFFTSRLTNAICEGINSLIQSAKRRARGYNTFKGYICMIYLIAAKLKLACPNPLKA